MTKTYMLQTPPEKHMLSKFTADISAEPYNLTWLHLEHHMNHVPRQGKGHFLNLMAHALHGAACASASDSIA